MKKSKNKMMMTSNKSKRSTTYKSRNNVCKTPYGTFRARKTINGINLGATFKFYRDAVAYINSLSGRSVSTKKS